MIWKSFIHIYIYHIIPVFSSLRTKENLEVVTKIPRDKLMIETDCPWCEVKPTHPGYGHIITKVPSVKKEKYSIESNNQVKGRNEPINIVWV